MCHLETGLWGPHSAPSEIQPGHPHYPQTASLGPGPGVGLAGTAQTWSTQELENASEADAPPSTSAGCIFILSKTCQMVKLTELTLSLLALAQKPPTINV